jgi:hypothetical protein
LKAKIVIILLMILLMLHIIRMWIFIMYDLPYAWYDHEANYTSFEQWSLGYILLGWGYTFPQQWAIMIHVLGYLEQLSPFLVISEICHWTLAHFGFGSLENVFMIFVSCHAAVTITESISVMDIRVFGGSEPLIHFVKTHAWMVWLWPYPSRVSHFRLSPHQKQMRQENSWESVVATSQLKPLPVLPSIKFCRSWMAWSKEGYDTERTVVPMMIWNRHQCFHHLNFTEVGNCSSSVVGNRTSVIQY